MGPRHADSSRRQDVGATSQGRDYRFRALASCDGGADVHVGASFFSHPSPGGLLPPGASVSCPYRASFRILAETPARLRCANAIEPA